MSVVIALPYSRPLTAADLESMPDDGHRYELIDGSLIASPAPSWPHQRVVGALYVVLRSACPPDLEVLLAPFDVRLADDTVLQPDVLVARRHDLTHRNLPVAPVLAVEVLSPSTRLIDLNLKKARYEEAGCASYWVVDPVSPRLLAWHLEDEIYAEVADVASEETWTSELPYAVTLAPAALLL